MKTKTKRGGAEARSKAPCKKVGATMMKLMDALTVIRDAGKMDFAAADVAQMYAVVGLAGEIKHAAWLFYTSSLAKLIGEKASASPRLRVEKTAEKKGRA